MSGLSDRYCFSHYFNDSFNPPPVPPVSYVRCGTGNPNEPFSGAEYPYDVFHAQDAKVPGNATQVAVGYSDACAISSVGLVCWGETLGYPRTQPLLDVQDVVVGHYAACARTKNNGFICLGQSIAPTALGWGSGFWRDYTSIALGFQEGCGVRADLQLECWGSASWGSAGGATHLKPSTPTQMGLGDVGRVALGQSHACAISGEALFCWGLNSAGQLGSGDFNERHIPQRALPASLLT